MTRVTRSMVTQNVAEASAFLASALTAGFVEDFVFRGYLQRQLPALIGSVVVHRLSIADSALHPGPLFPGFVRLIPAALFGFLFTLLALWLKSLRPGMIAHELGDGFGPIIFLLKHF